MEHSILKLEASAGSGKTYRLALEYLGRLLLAFAGSTGKAGNPRIKRELLGSILAITFTVKAAQEMKRRIVEMLKSFALSARGRELKEKDKEFLGQLANETHLSKKKIIELSDALIELVLSSYDDFNVTTIDSLMSAMVKAVSPDLDLPADYEIAIDARDEMESCGRAMLAKLADDEWPRLERFLEDFRRLNPNVTWKADDSIVAKVASLFRRTLQQGDAGAETLPDGLRARTAENWKDFREQLRFLFPILQERERGCKNRRFVSGTYLKEPLLAHIGRTLERGDDLSGVEEFIKSTFFCKAEPETLLINGTPDDQRERFCAAYLAAQQALRNAVLDFSAFKALPYREFLENFAAEWKHGKKTLFVEEFSHALAGLFDQWLEEAFPYLYLKLSDRFSSFLFDEFQDTSTLQFRALAPLIDEVLSRKEIGSFFIVGDRKQAIYRWRGGNSELMEERSLEGEVPAIRNLGMEGFSRTLRQNWRSKKEIVCFNNDFWKPGEISRIAAEADLQQEISANFHDSQQDIPTAKERAGGYVELSLHVEAEKSEEEATGETELQEDDGSALSAFHLGEIESIIRRLHDEHGYEYRDIAVLVRKNAQVRDIVHHLGREKIPGQKTIPTLSDQSLMLDSSPTVNEIIAFLSFLDYPPDDLSFFAFAGGKIFQTALAAHFPGEKKVFSEEVFINCQGPFYKLFQEKFPGSWKGLIEPFFQSVGFLPPYDLFSDITQVFRVYENFPGDTPFIMALGDALHRAERVGGSSIAGFLRQWRKMVEDEETPSVTIPENIPGVRVLTMHQSKGLEFSAVIVPVNDRGGRSDDNIHWDREGLFYINSKFALAHPGLKDRYQKENIRGTLDLLNLLYVAFTRAKEALFVPVATKNGITPPEAAADGLTKKISRASDAVGRHPLLAWFIEVPQQPVRRGQLDRKKKKLTTDEEQAPIHSKKMLTRSWQTKYLVFTKADAKERRDRPGAKRGERVHDLLSHLGEITGPRELDARVRELAAKAGWPKSDTQAIAQFLSRDDVFRLLGQGREIHLEKEIVDNAGDIPIFRRLDRLQTSPEEVLVIDFKTGKGKSEKYIIQMNDYLAAVGPLYPGRKCRGILLYVDRGEIEEVPCLS